MFKSDQNRMPKRYFPIVTKKFLVREDEFTSDQASSRHGSLSKLMR